MYKLRTTLKVLRAEHNLTQEEVARRVGVSRKTIVYLESGGYMPSYALVWNIAKLFDKTVEEVFYFEPTN